MLDDQTLSCSVYAVVCFGKGTQLVMLLPKPPATGKK
jgi:hypothetical protein